ncbi:hypothetical protein ATCCBAA256_19540 [Mycobacterium montefiorense]|nr:hypothetical protein ATCCBAA256_19540 [Mycobacterium montefiorense]
MFQPVPAAGDRDHPEISDHAFERVHRSRDRGVADDMKPGRHLRLAAGSYVRFDDVGVEIAGAAAVRRIGVGLVQPGGVRSEGTVDEQVTGQPARPRLDHQGASLFGGGHCFTPVADHFDAVIEGTQLQPIVEAADLGTGAFVYRDDAGRGGGPKRGGSGFSQLCGGEQAASDGPDQVVCVAGDRPIRSETACRREVGNQPAQPGRGQCGVNVDARQVGRPVAEHRVEVGGGRRAVLGPRRLIPPVPPDGLAGVGGGVVGDHLHAL